MFRAAQKLGSSKLQEYFFAPARTMSSLNIHKFNFSPANPAAVNHRAPSARPREFSFVILGGFVNIFPALRSDVFRAKFRQGSVYPCAAVGARGNGMRIFLDGKKLIKRSANRVYAVIVGQLIIQNFVESVSILYI